jgi:two-component system, NtrC family, response regulator AtoC
MSSHLYVVDDDPSIARLASMVFKAQGLEVESYTSPHEALSKLADPSVPNPVALILDLSMPRMDGRELYRRAREVGYTNPVVILSAYGAEAAQIELGAEAAVTKPFEPEVLSQTLKAVLGQDPPGQTIDR